MTAKKTRKTIDQLTKGRTTTTVDPSPTSTFVAPPPEHTERATDGLARVIHDRMTAAGLAGASCTSISTLLFEIKDYASHVTRYETRAAEHASDAAVFSSGLLTEELQQAATDVRTAAAEAASLWSAARLVAAAVRSARKRALEADIESCKLHDLCRCSSRGVDVTSSLEAMVELDEEIGDLHTQCYELAAAARALSRLAEKACHSARLALRAVRAVRSRLGT